MLSLLGIVIVCYWVPTVPRNNWRKISLISFFQVLTEPDLMRLNAGVFFLHLILTALFIAFPLSLEASTSLSTHQACDLFNFDGNGFFVDDTIDGYYRKKEVF